MSWPTPLISLPFARALAKVLNSYWTILWRINDGINVDMQKMILLLRERKGCCLDVAFSEKAADIWRPGLLCHSRIGQGKLAESFHRQPFLRVQQVSVLNIKLQQVGVCESNGICNTDLSWGQMLGQYFTSISSSKYLARTLRILSMFAFVDLSAFKKNILFVVWQTIPFRSGQACGLDIDSQGSLIFSSKID